MVYIELISY